MSDFAIPTDVAVRNRWWEANLAMKLYLARVGSGDQSWPFSDCLEEAARLLAMAKEHVFPEPVKP